MDNTEPTPAKARKTIAASLRNIFVTLIVLTAIWACMRYVLAPLVLGTGAPKPALASDEGRITTLEQRIAALESLPHPTNTVDLAPLEKRIAALEAAPKPEATPQHNEEIAALKDDVEKLKSDNHTDLKSIILIGQLQDAVKSGRPYANELSALIALKPELKEKLAPASASSATGVATLAQLQQQFAQSISGAMEPAQKSFTQNLRSLVKIRKVGAAQQGKDDEAIIARAEAKLNAGDIAAALHETDALSPAGMEKFARWQNNAKATLAASAALAALQGGAAQ